MSLTAVGWVLCWFTTVMLPMLIRDGFRSQKPPCLRNEIGQDPSFHPESKWHCTHCTHSLAQTKLFFPTQNRVTSLLPPMLLSLGNAQASRFAPSWQQGSAVGLFTCIDAVIVHWKTAACVFLEVKAGGTCLDHKYLRIFLLLIDILLYPWSNSFLPKETKPNLCYFCLKQFII